MAYTPNNNPYIPGDPYSYDLKWIICQIKKWAEQYSSLEAAFKALSDDFDALKKYVDDSITNLDFAPFVSDKIEEMAADGRLADILMEVFPMTTATIERMGRFINNYDEAIGSYEHHSQGYAYADHRFYMCGGYNSDANQTVTVRNENGQLLANRVYTELGHANSMCYLDGKLYVATGSRVAKIDAETLNLEAFINRSSSINSVFGVCTDGEKLFFLGTISGAVNGIDEYDPATGTVTNIFDSIIVGSGIKQNFTYYNGGFYLLYNRGSSVTRVSRNTGAITNVWKLPDDDGYFYTGEPEALFVKDDIICVGTGHTLDNSYTSGAPHFISQVFKTNISGYYFPTQYFSYIANAEPYLYYVNPSAAYVFNPTNTFTTCEELNLCVHSGLVRLVGNINGDYFIVPRWREVNIMRTGGSPVIGKMVVDGANVNLTSFKINDATFTGCNVYAKGMTMDKASVRFSYLRASESNIALTSCERSLTEFTNAETLGATAYNTTAPDRNFWNYDFRICKLTAPADIYAALDPLITEQGRTGITISLDAADGTRNYHFSTFSTRINSGANIVLSDNAGNKATWTASGLTFVNSSNAAITMTQVYNLIINAELVV